MINNIPKFFELAERKCQANNKLAKEMPGYMDNGDWNTHEMYIKAIAEELKETSHEIKDKNSIYLENELWDIFWTYINLLHTLDKKWYIKSEKVFDRSFKKFQERISGLENGLTWEQVKEKQNTNLKQEHNNTYN